VKISEILRSTTRKSDFPSRFGGEEFVLILPDTDHPRALQAAEKIMGEIRSSVFSIATGHFSLTVSIGISATTIRQYASANQMIEDADLALYAAKRNGKDRAEIFDPAKPPGTDPLIAH
jgi:diguanylate cyclase (GGDEF)-like protein